MTSVSSSPRAHGLHTPGWVALAIILSGGLFVFVWLALVARRAMPKRDHALVWLLPIGATLWIGGATFMFRGALAPTIPGETGNPQFFAGVMLSTLCLILMLVFNTKLTRHLVREGSSLPIRARVLGFSGAAVLFLLSQLVREVTPVAPQNQDILALFQFLCIMAAAVIGIQWVERVHERYDALLPAPAGASAQAAPTSSAHQL